VNNSKEAKAAKKRAAKSERNEKTIDVKLIEGFRGDDTIDNLLYYIVGKDEHKSQKNHPKNGIVSTNQTNEQQLINADDKKKKMVAKNKEKVNKLKKSNSMDELCSTGRQKQQQQEEQKQEKSSQVVISSSHKLQDVTLRSKSSNLTSGAKKFDSSSSNSNNTNNKEKSHQPKRNERRSWGTEGLWPDNDSLLSREQSKHQSTYETGDQHENNNITTATTTANSSSSSSSGVQLDFVPAASNNISNINNNNHTTISAPSITTTIKHTESISVAHSDSTNASNEADKFQVVIKKRKVKRKSNEAPESTKSASSTTVTNNLQSYIIRRDGGHSIRAGTTKNTNHNNNNNNHHHHHHDNRSSSDAKNQSNNNNKNSKPINSNDVHAKVQVGSGSSSSKNQRRKSTSSMPRSEEGDDGEYSDGNDSVQSLPIETTKTTSSLLSAPPVVNSHQQQKQQKQAPPTTSSLSSTTSSFVATNMNSNNTSAENSGRNNKKINTANANPNVIPPSQKPTTFSYADIAKTNTNRNNNNSNNNNNHHVIAASSTEKWPSISSSSSSHHTSSPTSNNNASTHQNDPFAISTFDAMSNINNSSHHHSNHHNNVGNVSTSTANSQQQKQPQQQKSTPSSNISSSAAAATSTNTMSFPQLVENNNNRNKQLSNSSPLDFNGDATQTEKSLNGLERAYDISNNNDNNNNHNSLNSNVDDRINNNTAPPANAVVVANQKLSYSLLLSESHHQQQFTDAIDSNGNNTNITTINSATTNTNHAVPAAAKLEANVNAVVSTVAIVSKNILTKSKSVDHNNLSSIEHYPALEKPTKQTLSDVCNLKVSKHQQQLQMKSGFEIGDNTNIVAIVKDEARDVGANKKVKKDKMLAQTKKNPPTAPSSSAVGQPPQQQQQQATMSLPNVSNHTYSTSIIGSSNANQSQQRPAVIILNDYEKPIESTELGLTFGFDINDDLLLGHQQQQLQNSCNNQNGDEPSVESNATINNNSNCDIMDTNLSTKINVNNNLNNQMGGGGIEMYESFIASPHQQPQQHQMSYPVGMIQSSSPKASAKDSNVLDSSNDLGYASLITNNSTSPPANVSKSTVEMDHQSNDVDHEQKSKAIVAKTKNNVDVAKPTKSEDLKILVLPRFISPEPSAKNFNFEELVTFVSEGNWN
jgi:hypothetical protein